MTCEVSHQNGRRYRVTDTEQPYQEGEYSTGGYVIEIWHSDRWVYLDNSPDMESVSHFLRVVERLK